MSTFIGRPPKYAHFIELLAAFEIYSPASIVGLLIEQGHLGKRPADIKRQGQRIRVALVRLSHSRNFPTRGDGLVIVHGQRPLPGWYGWRWKTIFEGRVAFLRV